MAMLPLCISILFRVVYAEYPWRRVLDRRQPKYNPPARINYHTNTSDDNSDSYLDDERSYSDSTNGLNYDRPRCSAYGYPHESNMCTSLYERSDTLPFPIGGLMEAGLNREPVGVSSTSDDHIESDPDSDEYRNRSRIKSHTNDGYKGSSSIDDEDRNNDRLFGDYNSPVSNDRLFNDYNNPALKDRLFNDYDARAPSNHTFGNYGTNTPSDYNNRIPSDYNNRTPSDYNIHSPSDRILDDYSTHTFGNYNNSTPNGRPPNDYNSPASKDPENNARTNSKLPNESPVSKPSSGGSNIKFTQLSPETVLPDYKRVFNSSRIFTFISPIDAIYKLTFVSTTKNYHPQFRLSEVNKLEGEKYLEVFGSDRSNGFFSTKYDCKKEKEYVIEIGSDEKISTFPFPNISTGGFICSMSSTKRTLQEYMAQQEYKISVLGWTATVPTENNKELSFTTKVPVKVGNEQTMEAGVLDYSLTPYYDDNSGSVTLYYHSSSGFVTKQSSSKKSASIEFQCSFSGKGPQPVVGKEAKPEQYEFKVPCKSVCEIVAILK